MVDKASLEDALKKRIRKLAHPLEPIATELDPKLAPLSDIKAVIFDVYGTMLIADAGEEGTESQLTRGNRTILESMNELDIETDPEVAGESIFDQFKKTVKLRRKEKRKAGNPVPEINIINIWRRVFEQLEDDNRIKGHPSKNEELLRTFSVEFELRFNPCWPMPNMKETLSELQNHEFVLGIISNSQFYTPLSIEALFEQKLNELGFSSTLLYWSYEHGIAKPAFGFYEPAVEKLKNRFGIHPEETLYIGNDMLNDIYPASELGFKTALFAGDQRSLQLRSEDERVTNLSPDLILTGYSQLKDCILLSN